MRYPIFVVFVAVTASACTGPRSGPSQEPTGQELVGKSGDASLSDLKKQTEKQDEKKNKPNLSLTDMLRFSSEEGACKVSPQGFYSRIVLTSDYCVSDKCDAPSADISKASSLLRKWFWPAEQTIVFTAQVGVEPDVAPVSRQLLLLTHNDKDNDNGETANAELLLANPALTPYFLVKPETVATIAVSARQQSKLSSGAVKMLARVTQQATTLLAPQSALATQLAQPAIRTQADNADKWLDLMFSFQDSETLTTGTAPAMVANGDIQVFSARLRTKGNREQYATAAKWTIRWDDPRVSMFAGDTLPCPTGKDPVADAKKTAEAITAVGQTLQPSQVLNFVVGQNKTVRELVAAQNWYRAASTQIGSGKGQERTAGIATFCAQVPGLMQQQNFNRYDAAAILWAALLDTPGIGDLGAELKKAPVCGRYRQTMVEGGLLPSP